jgi:hypothetical protein
VNKISQLTPNSWIIKSGHNNPGLLFRKPGGDYLFLDKERRLEFPDIQSVHKKFPRLEEDIKEESQSMNIGGYPVRHEQYEVRSQDPPLYLKGKVIFCAGYWAIKFANGWTLAFGPKQSTIETYESIGPFKNRLETLNRIGALNTQQHIMEKHGVFQSRISE